MEQGRAPSDSTFPPGWNPETRCYVCGVNRTPYELARHMKRAHLEASQANVGVGDRLYRRPPVRLPHCGTCKLFIGYGSDYAELHRQTELHQYRARKFPGRPSDSDVATETGRRGGVFAEKRQASPSMERASPGGGSAGDARQYEDEEGPEAFSSAIPQCDWLHRENDLPWHLSQVIGEVYLLAIELRSPFSAVPIKEETLRALGRNPTIRKQVRIVSLCLRGDDEV